MADAVNIGSIYADLDVRTGDMERGLAKGRQAMDAIVTELRTLDDEFRRGAIGISEYMSRMGTLNSTEAELARRMRTAHAAMSAGGDGLEIFNRQMQNGVSSASAMSRGLMQLGYMADDIQYGFSAIVNNIAPMVHGFTGNAGLAAAAQVAAVAAIQLSKRWNEVREAFGDTSAMEEAGRSLEGMRAKLKRLQEDADNFSWGDAVASFAGLSPDRGKAGMAANLEQALKPRERGEREAKSMEGFETDEQKKEKARFKEAVGENGGIDQIANKLGQDTLEKSGASPFLSVEKTMGGFGKSQKEEYEQLAALVSAHRDLPGERDRMLDLESTARTNAIKRAREQIGMAAGDKDAARAIGDRVGGHAGDVIAGRKDSKKDLKENRKKAEKAWEEEDKDFKQAAQARKKRIEDAAEKAVPDLKDRADREMADVARRRRKAGAPVFEEDIPPPETEPKGGKPPTKKEKAARLERRVRQLTGAGIPPEQARETAVSEVKTPLPRREDAVAKRAGELVHDGMPIDKARKQAADEVEQKTVYTKRDAVESLAQDLAGEGGLTEAEARDVAKAQIDRASEENPIKRKRRLKAENLRRAKEENPDVERQAEAGVMVGKMNGRGHEEFAKKLREQLEGHGFTADDAKDTAAGIVAKADRKVNEKLTNLARGHRREQEGKPPSTSQVYSASDASRNVQSAISDGPAETKKQTTLQQQMLEALHQLVSKVGDAGWEVN